MNYDVKPIKIAFADDHEIFREGFKILIKDQQLQLVGEAADGNELVTIVEKQKPDVVIIDIKMPVMDGVASCKVIKDKFPSVQVIALSMFNDDNLIIDMLEAGASGYLLKNTNKEEVLTAVIAVHEGSEYFCNETSQKLKKLIAGSNYNPYKGRPAAVFTPRELEIIQLMCQEDSNKEIADKLGLSFRSIEKYRERMREKVGARNSIGVVIYAIKHNIYKI